MAHKFCLCDNMFCLILITFSLFKFGGKLIPCRWVPACGELQLHTLNSFSRWLCNASINVKPKGGGPRAYVGHLTSIAFPTLRNLTKNLRPRVGTFAVFAQRNGTKSLHRSSWNNSKMTGAVTTSIIELVHATSIIEVAWLKP